MTAKSVFDNNVISEYVYYYVDALDDIPAKNSQNNYDM